MTSRQTSFKTCFVIIRAHLQDLIHVSCRKQSSPIIVSCFPNLYEFVFNQLYVIDAFKRHYVKAR